MGTNGHCGKYTLFASGITCGRGIKKPVASLMLPALLRTDRFP